MSDSTQSILLSVRQFFSGTLLSRITGLGRDISMAYAFGASEAVAALMVAFRLAHLLRRLFGEGALQTAFIPHFEELRSSNAPQAFAFFRQLSNTLALFLSLLTMIAMGLLYFSLPYFSTDGQQVAVLTLLMLPSLPFICLFGLNSSLLQCQKHYFITGAAPAAFNLLWIAGVALSASFSPLKAMNAMAICIVAACVGQWAATLPAIRKQLKNFPNTQDSYFAIAKLRPLATPFSLAIAGVAATQINSAIDPLFARYADVQGPAYLWYAIRIEQLPLALFGIALAGALLPPLSRAIKGGHHEKFSQLYHFAQQKTFTFMAIVTAGIILLGPQLVNVLYGHGDFNNQAAYETTLCLWAYSLGLIPSALLLITAPAFYAKGNYSIPATASALSVLFSIGSNAFLVLVCGWGAASIAVSTSLAAFLNYYYLKWQLQNTRQAIRVMPIWLCIGLGSAAAVACEHLFFGWNFSGGFISQFGLLVLKGCMYCIVLLISAWLINCREILEILRDKKTNLECGDLSPL